MKKLILLCSTAVVLPTAAFAQSTGSQDIEKKGEEVVVTATRAQQVGGVISPDTSKAKAVLTQQYIARQNPGQTVLDTINAVPGVSFQNNDAYGSSGGTLTIRGFDSSRISLTLDGIPLNDSGNYAIYSNQQLDPELLDQVNVNLGTTDVDSPTASAVGGTVNLRTRNPNTKFGGRVVGSLGEDDFRRIFAVVDTGEIGPWGTRAFFAVSTAKNDNPFNNYGKVDKQQYNAKIYQPVGANGDFVSVALHYNENRNNFFGSLPLRTDLTQNSLNTTPRVVGPNSGNRYPRNGDERFYDINYPCQTDTPQGGVVDTTAAPPTDQASCGTEFDRRYNPSNTGNLKVQSRWTLTDKLVLTVDPSFQVVKANGGGTVIGREGVRRINGVDYTGFIGGQYYFGRDLNGDGDILDTCSTTGGSCSSTNFAGVTLIAPSQTHTNRYGVIAGLRYDINDDHTVRLTYTLDHAQHRQTGELGFVDRSGEPLDVFPINDPIQDSGGFNMQKRDRESKAILNQVSGEYRGEFFDDRLTVNAGLRLPFFKRDLNQNCFTTSAGGFVDCFAGNATEEAAYAIANPYVVDPVTGRVISGYSPPQRRVFKYDKLLPNVGFTYDVTHQVSVFANYAQGLSVPSTDNLYNSFYFPTFAKEAKPDPETTNSIDAGVRYRSSQIQAQLGVWTTKFKNRSASAYDPDLNQTIYRNLGTVDKWGLDGSIAYSPIKQISLLAFGSWMDSEIKKNIQIGSFGGITDCDNISSSALASDIIRSCALTAGHRESGAPKYTYGFSALGSIGDFDIGFTAKRTGPRYIFDNGQAVFETGVNLTTLNDGSAANDPHMVFGSTAPAYWLVNLDARYNLRKLMGLEKSYFQLNVYNLFDKFYVGGFGGGLSQALNSSNTQYSNPPFVQIGAPRTVSGTLSIEF